MMQGNFRKFCIVNNIRVKSVHFFSKYSKHAWTRNYEYMNKLSIEWNEKKVLTHLFPMHLSLPRVHWEQMG